MWQLCAIAIVTLAARAATAATPPAALQGRYMQLRDQARQLAGGPGDIAQRAVFLNEMFRDSRGNHAFPQIALHGAMWARRFFNTADRVTHFVRRLRLPRTATIRQLDEAGASFELALQRANREVFVDTYTNYWFSKERGHELGAELLVHPALLARLNEMHDVTRRGGTLGPDQRRELFVKSLEHEQEQTVSAAVTAAVDRIPSEFRGLLLHPTVRFSYFPFWRYFFFKDFSSTAERIHNATRSYDVAEKAGWKKVSDRMRAYDELPRDYFRDRQGFTDRLRVTLTAQPSTAR
jgi:hypothetical protein